MTQIIELSENSVQILNKQQLTENNIVVFKVDTGNMPIHKAQEYLQNFKDNIVGSCSPASVWVMSNKVDVSIIEKQ
jgi:hypothetical protein